MAETTPRRCRCGSELFYESVRVSGWWKRLLDGYGNTEDTDLSEVRYGPNPKTVVCAECDRRVLHPKSVATQ